jgi:hypothetical protein
MLNSKNRFPKMLCSPIFLTLCIWQFLLYAAHASAGSQYVEPNSTELEIFEDVKKVCELLTSYPENPQAIASRFGTYSKRSRSLLEVDSPKGYLKSITVSGSNEPLTDKRVSDITLHLKPKSDVRLSAVISLFGPFRSDTNRSTTRLVFKLKGFPVNTHCSSLEVSYYEYFVDNTSEYRPNITYFRLNSKRR